LGGDIKVTGAPSCRQNCVICCDG